MKIQEERDGSGQKADRNQTGALARQVYGTLPDVAAKAYFGGVKAKGKEW